jgi:hypothetical protein
MTFEQFLAENNNTIFAYYALCKKFGNKFLIETPYPPAILSDEDLQILKERLNQWMPFDSMIVDLWDWDIHFEEQLGEDWYFETVFGPSSSIESCADTLAEFFLECIDEYNMDYAQNNWTDADFEKWIKEQCSIFIKTWRQKIINEFTSAKWTPTN